MEQPCPPALLDPVTIPSPLSWLVALNSLLNGFFTGPLAGEAFTPNVKLPLAQFSCCVRAHETFMQLCTDVRSREYALAQVDRGPWAR